MQITLNGTLTEVPDQAPVSVLIEGLGLGGMRFAVEVNEEILPRSQFDRHHLSPADRVEIIQAVGGG